ncbi:serine protease [Iningainema tapete]|uniref:Tetratricopeptide repeat protein n=1 Tax=Iningainema tapete BLCC-T55 TaxID=2748662 RepID=A0A8J7C3W4_9CYAN|nr:serine protease [Iningainema tapete]MBD2770564.1 tetratricopeptide repeat protein [Iningainema tapete BLCC-T55]
MGGRINSQSLALIASIGTVLMLPIQGLNLSISAPIFARQQVSVLSQRLQKLAQSITVKIISGNKGGSGILIQKEGQIYTVLTSHHVIESGKPNVIETPDGKNYPAELVKEVKYDNKDVVLLQFRATTNYAVASLGNSSTLKEGDEVFASGFPFEDNSSVSREFVTKAGRISLLLERSLKGGYKIGYTIEVEKGMSGGPVLNREGKVIGINGIHAQPLWGDPYVYEDGSQPNDALRERMRRSSWGVPIETLAYLDPPIFPPENPQPRNIDFKRSNNSTPVVSLIDNIAKQITVLITWQNRHGTGVLVAKEGNKYYVLTAGHVVRGKKELNVVTPDNQQYSINISTIKTWEGTDLALLQFTSSQNYQVATLADYNLGNEDRVVFVSGTPASKEANLPSHRLFSAGLLYAGGIDRAKDARSFSFGYELVYTNFTDKGMSGSPVLDSLGRVIGIHTAAEGEPTLIKQKIGEAKEIQLGYSLGVPIRTFLALVEQEKTPLNLKKHTTIPPKLSEPQQDQIITSALKPEPPEPNADEFEWLNYGNKLLRSQKYEKAVEAFERAIAIKSDLYQAWYAKGRAQRLQQKYQDAFVSFQKATVHNPNYDPAWRELGDTLFALNRYDEARQVLEKVIELKPDEFIAYRGLCNVLGELGNYTKAIKACDQAIKLNPQPLQYMFRGEMLMNMGDTTEAIQDFNTALRLQPDNPFAYRQRGLARAYEENYLLALADLNKAISLQPDNAYAYVDRGIIRAKMGQQAFMQDFDKALTLEPDSASIYDKRGFARYYRQDYNGAAEDYNAAIRFTPESAYLYYKKLGDVRTAQKDYKGAIENYTAAISKEPNYAPAYVGRGMVHAIVNNKQGFTEDFQTALRLQPDNPWFYTSRGNGQFILKDHQLGIQDYNKAISLFPKLAYLYYTLRGNTRAEQKDYAGAIADYNEAIRLKPDFYIAYNNRGLARIAQEGFKGEIAPKDHSIRLNYNSITVLYVKPDTQDSQKDYRGAISDFTEAIRLKPDFTLAYNNRGFARSARNDHQGAIADYNEAIRLNPNNALLYLNRGWTRLQQKDDKGAMEDFKIAIRLQPELAETLKNKGVTLN